ncbi:PPOX class F420-dependent oxidoreductase [Micromonospora mangrovi]|uniref:PPOX class F420-dependent oxidoreductase n=2 Tax=Micromonospora TaxID=1873 RepID=A0AAU8HFT4_9ACTN
MPQMSRQEAMTFLAYGTRTGKLATTSPAGIPHVAPIWFVVVDGMLVFTTGADTVKGRNLRTGGHAALCVDTEEYPYDFVTVRGEVEVSSDAPDLLAWTTRIASRYVPAGQEESYGRRNAVPGELLCRLTPHRVTGATDIAL